MRLFLICVITSVLFRHVISNGEADDSAQNSDISGSSAQSDTGGAPAAAGSMSMAVPETFRVVFIADTHVIGPQYTCCHESDGVDNASIMKTPRRLKAIRETINGRHLSPTLSSYWEMWSTMPTTIKMQTGIRRMRPPSVSPLRYLLALICRCISCSEIMIMK